MAGSYPLLSFSPNLQMKVTGTIYQFTYHLIVLIPQAQWNQ